MYPEFDVIRDLKSQFHHSIIEKKRSGFKRLSHAHAIGLDQIIAWLQEQHVYHQRLIDPPDVSGFFAKCRQSVARPVVHSLVYETLLEKNCWHAVSSNKLILCLSIP